MADSLFDLDSQPVAGRLHELAWGFQQARILQVAVALDLFTALASGPLAADQLARALGSDAAQTERLLIALAALDLVSHDDGRWANRLAADLCLVAGRPLYQGHAIRHAADVWERFADLERVVREGGAAAERERAKGSQADRHDTFIRAMHALAVAGQAQRLVRLVTQLAGRRRLLDVGAGPGTYSIAICQRYPSITATLWDLPETLAIAREIVAHYGLDDRISLKAGNWESDDFGSGYDVVLMSNILHGPGSLASEKLMKAYAALEEGGLLVVNDFLLDNDLSGPLPAALFNLRVGAFTVDQMLAVIQEAGFDRASLISSAGRTSVAIAFKPYLGGGDLEVGEAMARPEIEEPIERPIPGTGPAPSGGAVLG